MLRVVVFCALIAAAFSIPFADKFDRIFDDDWELFKKVHNKMYSLFSEELSRRSIWETNLKIITKHNLEYDLGNHTYRLGMNFFGDMTNKEFVQQMNGYKKRSDAPKALTSFNAPKNIKLSQEVDWRTKGFVTPVKNQGQCSSSWAFSATGSLEGQMFAKTGILPVLSEQNLVDCSYAQGNTGCSGGFINDAFTYVNTNNGLDREICYPYVAKNQLRCYYQNSTDCNAAVCMGFVYIGSGSETQLKIASATIGPISVAIDASHSSFHFYDSGVYSEPECSSRLLDLSVLVVGYGSAGVDNDYWIVKNSWGDSWGMNGYIMMSRNKDNQCGIATSASYPLV